MCQYCRVFFERLEIIAMDSPFTVLAEENLLLDGSIGVMVFDFKKILQLGRRQKFLLAPAYKPSLGNLLLFKNYFRNNEELCC